MRRTDPLKLDARQPAIQPPLWIRERFPCGSLIPSELHRETEAAQERRTREGRKDRETGRLFN